MGLTDLRERNLEVDRVRCQLSVSLTQEHVRQIVEDAYWVVENVGVEVGPEALRRPLVGEQGIHTVGHHVRIDSGVVRSCWDKAQPTDVVPTEKLVLSNGGNAMAILDPASGMPRPPTVPDLIDMSKLCDAFHLEGYAPLLPQDLPPKLQEVAANYFARLHARSLGGGLITTRASAELVYEMSLVAGPPMRLEYYVASPLAFDETGLDLVLAFHGRGVPIAVGAYVLAGNSAPMSLSASWTQWLAENLAAVVLMTYACEGDKIQWMADGGAHAFDFRYTNMRAGSPEEVLFRLTGIELMRHLGVEARGTITTMAKQPDMRAAAERLGGMMVYALDGVRAFYGGGLLAFDSLFSAEQLVMDTELLAYVDRVLRGMKWDGSATCREAVTRPDRLVDYLMDDLTLGRMRSETWSSGIFEYSSLQQWGAESRQSTSQRLRDVVSDMITRHEFELAPERKRALDTIWERAQAVL